MANSQHRCVFVGNIPYDATEEQLIQICEEVGPVVSFRLVIDRETGKPKGYGFCEYKDEETALSARRNLHGYDINGRQLRVDFAENDKNSDKNREQGRGGPGLTTNIAPQKQIGGPAVHGGDPSQHQGVGLQDAMAAAIVMAGALGGGQTNNNASQNGIRSQPIPGTDPLTLHLAKIPKAQLIEVLNELKVMATQNKEQTRQLLLARPQLSKAVLQSHIMLKSVPPHLLQMPNVRQLPAPHANPLLPPLAQTKMAIGSQSQPSLTPTHPAFPTQHQALHPQQPIAMSTSSSKLQYPAHILQDNLLKASSATPKDQHNPGWGQIGHSTKLLKMEDGRGASFSPADVKPSGSVLSSQKQNHELPGGVESGLLEQVLNLTPEQLSSLPAEQQQQVIQLQQMLRQST